MSQTAADLKFGTSGLRGLARILAGRPAFAYTAAFLRMLADRGEIVDGGAVLIGRDLRPSSPEIARIISAAIKAAGFRPVDFGELPTPALALAALEATAPAIMVTGSHIPADRNGLKFYGTRGEIDKRDEAAIAALVAAIPVDERPATPLPASADKTAAERYKSRYLDFFPARCLSGLSVGVWQHSTVARDTIVDILQALGATVTPLGRSDHFVPIDTEAVSAADRRQAAEWVAEYGLDAIVSADGDADRPLVFDETGAFVEGELLGAIAAEALGADVAVTPLTSNSGIEASGRFRAVRRCRVGSPFVIEEMQHARAGAGIVVGFEANGGVLLGSDVTRQGRLLRTLPTRDCMIPILCCLEAIGIRKMPLSAIAAGYGFMGKAADRLERVPQVDGARLVSMLADPANAERLLGATRNGVASVDGRDGARVTFGDGTVLHFRMSGNAPELRCYAEAPSDAAAQELLEVGMAFARTSIFASEVA